MGSKFRVPRMDFETMQRLYPNTTEAIQKMLWIAEDINQKHKCKGEEGEECTTSNRRLAIDARIDLEIAKLLMQMTQQLDPDRAMSLIRDVMLQFIDTMDQDTTTDGDTPPNAEALEQAAMLFKRLSNEGGKPH